MKKRSPNLKVRQEILDYLKKHQITHSPVTLRELMGVTGIKSTSVVSYHLDVLEDEGKIKRDPNKARMIEVIHD